MKRHTVFSIKKIFCGAFLLTAMVGSVTFGAGIGGPTYRTVSMGMGVGGSITPVVQYPGYSLRNGVVVPTIHHVGYDVTPRGVEPVRLDCEGGVCSLPKHSDEQNGTQHQETVQVGTSGSLQQGHKAGLL
jgi:hypothetical protein